MRSTLFQLLLYLFWITTFTWKPNDNRRFTKLMELWKHCLVAEHDRWTATSASGPSRMQVLLPGTAFQSTFVASPHLKPSEDIWKRFYSLKLLTLPRTFNIVMPAGHLCKWTQYRRWYWWWWCPVRLRCLKNSTACNRHLNPVHTGDTKLTLSATKSTATVCRIHVVSDLLPKPATKLNVSATKLNAYWNSRLCCRSVAGFGNSRLSTKSTVLNLTLSPVCTGLNMYGYVLSWNCWSFTLQTPSVFFLHRL